MPQYQTTPVYPKGEGDWEGSGTETGTIMSGTGESGTKTKLYRSIYVVLLISDP